MSESLLDTCVLPGCRTPVATVGDACQGCRDAFGPMLRMDPDAPRMTAEEIAERDSATHRIYEHRAMMRQAGMGAR